MRRWPRTVLVVLWIALAVLSWAFSGGDGAGGDDDPLVMTMGAALAGVALLWTTARSRLPFGALDVGVHAVLVLVQVFYLGLLALDDGSAALTVLRDRGWALGGWLAVLAALGGGVVLAAVTEARERG